MNICSKNDYEGYYEQGYESQARSFSAQLTRATDIVITEAIKQAMKGDANEQKQGIRILHQRATGIS